MSKQNTNNKHVKNMYNDIFHACNSYYEPRSGKKSDNIFIRIIDFLCSRQGGYFSLFTEINNVFLVLGLMFGLPIAVYYSESDYILSRSILLLVGVFAFNFLFSPQGWYRFFRSRYFKMNNLPGPYGWGTLDPSPTKGYSIDECEGICCPAVLFLLYKILTGKE